MSKALGALLFVFAASAASGQLNPEYDQHLKVLASEIPTWRQQIERMDITVLGTGYGQGKVIEDSRRTLLEDLSGIDGCMNLVRHESRLSDQLGLLLMLGTADFMAKTFSDNLRIFAAPQNDSTTAPWRAQLNKIMETLNAEQLFQATSVGDRIDELEKKAKP